MAHNERSGREAAAFRDFTADRSPRERTPVSRELETEA